MTIKLRLAQRAAIIARVSPRLGASVAGGDGITVTFGGNVYTVASSLTFPLSPTSGGTGTSTAFTLGSVVFAGSGGAYSQDNSNFFWDNTNNRLGIGTAAPDSFLHISTPSDSPTPALHIAQTGTTDTIPGTSSPAWGPGANGFAYNSVYIAEDSANVGTGSDSDITFGLNVAMNTGGTTSGGQKVALGAVLLHDNATPTSGQRDHVGANSRAIITAGEGGTDTGAGSLGRFYASGTQIFASDAATNLTAIVGDEIDVGLLGTATAKYVMGLNVVNQSTGSQGASEDAGILISSVTGALGFKDGIKFARTNGIGPVSTTGSLISATGADTAVNGIDLSTYTFTGDLLKGANANITGAGNLVLSSTSGSSIVTNRPNIFTAGANAAAVTVLAGAADKAGYIQVGRTVSDSIFGVAGTTNDFITGTAVGDTAVKATGDLWLGKGTSAGIKIGTSGLVTLSSGQLAFPATQAASSDANTLDDYEEGTFTPALTFATPGDLSTAYSVQAGTYLKIGKGVTITFNAVATTFTHTTASGDLIMTGLPFTAVNEVNDRWRGTMQFQGITKATYTNFTCGPLLNTTTMLFIASGSGVAVSTVTAADCPTGTTKVIQGSVTYLATN